jgi:PhnB protein
VVVLHAELALGRAVVMVGGLGPRNAGPPPDRVRSGVYVFVDDVEAHYSAARAAGATILLEPADQPYGDRYYLATDHEGHEWYVAQHLRDVVIEDLQRQLRP